MTEKKSSSSGMHRISISVETDGAPEQAMREALNEQLKADLRLGTVARALRACVEAIRGALDDAGSRISDETRVRLTDAVGRSEGILDRYVTADDKPKEP